MSLSIQPSVQISKLQFKNIKSFNGKHETELAPLTLIFGPNSAGKSTLVQTISLLSKWDDASDSPFIGNSWNEFVVSVLKVAHQHHLEDEIMVGAVFGATEYRTEANLLEKVSVPETLFSVAIQKGGNASNDLVFDLAAQGAGGAMVEYKSIAQRRNNPNPGSKDIWVLYNTDQRPPEIETASRVLRRIMMGLRVLGPFRGSPSDPYKMRWESETPWDMPSGAQASELYDDSLNAWLQKLDIPYALTPVTFRDYDAQLGDEDAELAKSYKIVRDASREFDFLVPRDSDMHHWRLTDIRNNVQVELEDVGYGISQIIPIVDACVQEGIDKRLITIEQPELHLHPRLQANLAELFVDSVKRGNQLIVETHSEPILIRLRRLIREGAISPKDVAVLYVDNKDSNGARVERLELGEKGELLRPWPTGFFDDTLKDVLGGWN